MTASPTTILAGRRLRERRTAMGLSQTAIGKHLGVTFQQVQKYENGLNQLSHSRLLHLSAFLGVPLTYFSDDREAEPVDRSTLELMKAYQRIADAKVKKQVRSLVAALAGQ